MRKSHIGPLLAAMAGLNTLRGINMLDPFFSRPTIGIEFPQNTSEETLNKIAANKELDKQNRINKAAEKRARQIKNRAFKKGE